MLTDQYDKQIAQGDVLTLSSINVMTYGLSFFSLGSDSTYVVDLSKAEVLDGSNQLSNIMGEQWLKL